MAHDGAPVVSETDRHDGSGRPGNLYESRLKNLPDLGGQLHGHGCDGAHGLSLMMRGLNTGNNPANQAMAEMRLVTIDQATVISRQGELRSIRGVSRRLSMTARCWGAVFVFHERVQGDRHLAHRTPD